MLNDYGNENGKKRSIGLISKKKKKLCTCSALVWKFLFPVVATCMKLAGNTFSAKMSYVLVKNIVACVPIRHFFLLPLIFNLPAASISRFLNAALKLSCFSSNEIRHLYFSPVVVALCRSYSLWASLARFAYFLIFSVFLCLSSPNLWTWQLI